MNYSFQSELYIADFIKLDEQMSVVFSPKYTDILYKVSAAVEHGSFFA
jgi:hypothetical protein